MTRLLSLLLLLGAVPSALAQSEANHDAAVRLSLYQVANPEAFPPLQAEVDAHLRTAGGFVARRGFTAFFGMAPEHDEASPVRIDLTSFASADALTAAVDGLESRATYDEYLAAVESLAALALRPFDAEDAYDVASLAQPGQVLEVAVRDLTAYDDRGDFFETIGAFVALLTAQPGVVREYQWISLDGTTFVGMTVYEDMDAFGLVSQNPDVLQSPEAGALFASYPPVLAQYALLTSE